jgi:hypothetical protein
MHCGKVRHGAASCGLFSRVVFGLRWSCSGRSSWDSETTLVIGTAASSTVQSGMNCVLERRVEVGSGRFWLCELSRGKEPLSRSAWCVFDGAERDRFRPCAVGNGRLMSGLAW